MALRRLFCEDEISLVQAIISHIEREPMKFSVFFHAVKSDIEAVWKAIEGSPAVQEVEKIAVDAVASELQAVADKFLGDGTPLDKAIEGMINMLAAKIVAGMPTSPVENPPPAAAAKP